MNLESVGALGIHTILSKLGPKETATVACLSKSFRDWASDDSLWSHFCSQELHLSSPQTHLGNPSPSFKAAYQEWREAFQAYPWTLVVRVKRCWDRIKNWLAINFPEAWATLRPGVSENEINEFENRLKLKLPLPTRLLYRFCDGQEISTEESSGNMLESSSGLIGGYSFYEFIVNVFLLPLSLMVRITKNVNRRLGFSGGTKYAVVAASFTSNEKVFLLNCADGQLFVGARNLLTDREMIPCVPGGLISSVHDNRGDSQQDGLLLWLEEHIRRLETGTIKLREESNKRSISQFPELPPLCSTAVTCGVQVRASSVFAPEFSDLQHESDKFLFVYSIRISLAPDGCLIDGKHFRSCQLYRRHWQIWAKDNIVANVSGEAVIGMFPILLPEQKEFVYESCSNLASTSGSIEGSFLFAPGSLAETRGDFFLVRVERFPLELPDYIY